VFRLVCIEFILFSRNSKATYVADLSGALHLTRGQLTKTQTQRREVENDRRLGRQSILSMSKCHGQSKEESCRTSLFHYVMLVRLRNIQP